MDGAGSAPGRGAEPPGLRAPARVADAVLVHSRSVTSPRWRLGRRRRRDVWTAKVWLSSVDEPGELPCDPVANPAGRPGTGPESGGAAGWSDTSASPSA